MPGILSPGFSGTLSRLEDLSLWFWAHPVSSETAICESGAMFQKHQMEEAFGLEIPPGNIAKENAKSKLCLF